MVQDQGKDVRGRKRSLLSRRRKGESHVICFEPKPAQLCEEMHRLEAQRISDGVHQKTLHPLVKFVDDFKSLNFAGDVAMERQVDWGSSAISLITLPKQMLSRYREPFPTPPSSGPTTL